MRKIKNFFHKIEAFLSSFLMGFPAYKMKVIGVTGTDGKTTTVSIIFHLLKNAGYKVGMINTLGAKINDENISIGLHTTTPSSFQIQKLLKKMYLQGCQYAVIEVTSHAIDQQRILGCNFQIGILTNITHEHLDYHKNYLQYLKTKIKFLNKCPVVIINKDDGSFDKVTELLPGKKIISYAIDKKSDLQGKNLENNGQSFLAYGKINDQKIDFNITSKLEGRFNVLNSLAGIIVAVILKIPSEKIINGFENLPLVKGRMELVIAKPFKVIVDFAHTPNAFKEVLSALNTQKKGRIIHVFGATGKRDVSKRSLMGEISGKLSDICIITSEDTYGEKPDKIILEIEKGILISGKKLGISYWKINDREEAIKKAIEIAGKDDLILLTGVGHQTSLNLGDKELPWNDSQKVKELINLIK